MAQDRTGPGFGPSQDPYDVERRELRQQEMRTEFEELLARSGTKMKLGAGPIPAQDGHPWPAARVAGMGGSDGR